MKKLMTTLATLSLISGAVQAENKCETSNGYITTRVKAEAKASMLHTVKHHWKFEFWKGAVCWGKPDDHYQDNQNFLTDSDQCEGKINFTTNKGNQVNYTPVSLSWGANLTDEDTFTINLTDERVQAIHKSSGSKCTSHHMATKIDMASVTYETKAMFNIPQDVWIVQVRANAEASPGSRIAELQPRIGRVVLKNDNKPDSWLLSLAEKKWTYLYVEPGEQLELNLSYANQGLEGKKKYNARYDFKFIGHNRCLDVLGDPKSIDYNKYLANHIRKEVTTEEEYHNYAVKLGCLRNPVYMKAGMNNSGPESLLPALESLSTHTKEVIRSTVGKEKGEQAGAYLATILDMTLVDMSRFALSDLLNYCKTFRDFRRETLTNPHVTEIAGIEYMMLTYSHLQKIYSQLATDSLSVLVNNVESWSQQKLTYAQLFDGNREAQKALQAYQHSMVQLGLGIYGVMAHEISANVPQVEVHKSFRERLFSNILAAKKIAGWVNVSTLQMLRNFGSRSNEVIDAGQLSTNVKQLLEYHRKIEEEMREYFKWFISADQGGDNGDRFVRTLSQIHVNILAPSAQTLEFISKNEKIKSLDEKFVRRTEINDLSAKVKSCIFNPYGGVK